MKYNTALKKVRSRVKVARDHLGWAVAVDGKVVDFFWSRMGATAGRKILIEQMVQKEQEADAQQKLVR